VLPQVERIALGLSGWLGRLDGRALVLKPDLDSLPALSGERDALWASLERTTFLSRDEKRAIAGFSPLAE
jgi:phage portal protein BeeE